MINPIEYEQIRMFLAKTQSANPQKGFMSFPSVEKPPKKSRGRVFYVPGNHDSGLSWGVGAMAGRWSKPSNWYFFGDEKGPTELPF